MESYERVLRRNTQMGVRAVRVGGQKFGIRDRGRDNFDGTRDLSINGADIYSTFGKYHMLAGDVQDEYC